MYYKEKSTFYKLKLNKKKKITLLIFTQVHVYKIYGPYSERASKDAHFCHSILVFCLNNKDRMTKAWLTSSEAHSGCGSIFTYSLITRCVLIV